MAGKPIRALIAGAGSALGKELADVLSESASAVWDVTLADVDEAGQLSSAGDEALVVAKLERGTFAGSDVVFFADDADTTRAHWRDAQAAGAAIVDLTGALANEDGVLVLAPGVGAAKADLGTVAAIAAHPAAVLLGRVAQGLGDVRLAATLLEPASQQGREGMEELQKQAVALLSFQDLPKDIYDAQVAFALRDALGNASSASLADVSERIRRDFAAIADDGAKLALQVVQGAVFHGYTASVWVEGAQAAQVTPALEAVGVRVVGAEEDEEVSNTGIAGQAEVVARVTGDQDGCWLWLAADNLQLAARNAEACANELLALRATGPVQ
jgi:aspartate-semialdehyde dehydrogenase